MQTIEFEYNIVHIIYVLYIQIQLYVCTYVAMCHYYILLYTMT